VVPRERWPARTTVLALTVSAGGRAAVERVTLRRVAP
jgi:hypothetical protein